MILTLYIVLLALACVLIGLGFFVDVPAYTLVGFAFMFILALLMYSGSIEYATGVFTEDLYQYGNNFTGYHWDYDTGTAPDGPQTEAYIFHRNTTTTNSYTAFDDTTSRTIGLYLAAASILGFAIVLASLRSPKGMRS